MSARPRLRTVVAAVATVLAVTAGPAVLSTAVATAVPGGSEFPFDENAPGRGTEPKTDERAERAEKFGGGLATELVDLGGNVLKCGLSIATKTVTCPL
ncbi:hypothetical protein BOX37_24305 [Nocardia mangyaensis]|uniref:DUF732 domain-containing protein n=1 Tax=Nocardia mangyaensis TaxID=2213200 RepID=A0A1J0VWU4_9NOCA|nr:hypothetical protein [Nocardia mangyaensis]APE36531.1 hypothetical protein BOX37_24305 [Nocardia mangyaensis]